MLNMLSEIGVQQMSEKTEKLELGIAYECVKCGAVVALKELELRGGGVKCTHCGYRVLKKIGYRVLKKIRPPVVKRIKAR
jgi:DNA-directed RNA polymerase subunit RPC12/RpoP